MSLNGFSDLVAIVIENWTWDQLPERDDDVWDALLTPIFLGRTIRSAQANYVRGVLYPIIRSAAHDAITNPHWSQNVIRRINAEKGRIRGTLGEGLKSAILTSVAQEETQNLTLGRTLGDALSFFEANNIGVDLIREIQNDSAQTTELVVDAADAIHNVKHIKAVLWLYNCGIATNLAPPNSHVKRFLNERGFPGFGWTREEDMEDAETFFNVNRRMREVAQQVSRDLGQPVTTKQAQAAVWYLQTCRGLELPRGYPHRLSPQVLIDFLENQRWSINELDNRLGDVEQLGSLTEELKAFLVINRTPLASA